MHGTNVLFTVEFVAQQADGEGAGPVDDLPAVGTALFEDGGRPVWGRHGDPYRADRLFGGSLERWGRLANSLKLRLAMPVVAMA